MNKSTAGTANEGDLIEMIDKTHANLEIDDSALDNAEAATSNPPPPGDNPIIHIDKLPPLNSRIQAGDYSGAPTYVDEVLADDAAEAIGNYDDDNQDEDVMDPQKNLMTGPITPRIATHHDQVKPAYTDFNEFIRATLNVIREDTINYKIYSTVLVKSNSH